MHWLIICTAALFAGGLNAIAGGGSFLTFPALVLVGVPPIMANATGTAALLPGYVTGALAFKDDLGSLRSMTMKKLVVFSLIGGLIGASLLLATSDAGFRRIIPWLLLAATCLFAFGGKLANRYASTAESAGTAGFAAGSVWPSIVVFLVAIYGGYFNGGLGILLLAAFALLGETNMNSMNGLKNIASAVLTAISVLVYALGDAINWPLAFAMMVCSTLGGYLGGRLARKMPAKAVRTVVIITGAVMTLIFFQK
ncbi:MAG: sulfite exporter TauE/SafE family protein [Glaciimonas sp.]|nr:sulfite exporter TauE/SafE family protein [Glaciimonas sp.]